MQCRALAGTWMLWKDTRRSDMTSSEVMRAERACTAGVAGEAGALRGWRPPCRSCTWLTSAVTCRDRSWMLCCSCL